MRSGRTSPEGPSSLRGAGGRSGRLRSCGLRTFPARPAALAAGAGSHRRSHPWDSYRESARAPPEGQGSAGPKQNDACLALSREAGDEQPSIPRFAAAAHELQAATRWSTRELSFPPGRRSRVEDPRSLPSPESNREWRHRVDSFRLEFPAVAVCPGLRRGVHVPPAAAYTERLVLEVIAGQSVEAAKDHRESRTRVRRWPLSNRPAR